MKTAIQQAHERNWRIANREYDRSRKQTWLKTAAGRRCTERGKQRRRDYKRTWAILKRGDRLLAQLKAERVRERNTARQKAWRKTPDGMACKARYAQSRRRYRANKRRRLGK